MKRSAGLVIIQNNQILLGHPTGSAWYGTYSIPKGEIEDHENSLKAAIRETREELGVEISTSDIVVGGGGGTIEYKNDKGEIYKTVEYFVAKPSKPIIVDKSKLQKDEIDWAGFLTKEEAEKRIFGRFKPLLKYLK